MGDRTLPAVVNSPNPKTPVSQIYDEKGPSKTGSSFERVVRWLVVTLYENGVLHSRG